MSGSSPSANPSFEGQGAEDLNIKLAATVQDLFTSSNHMDLKSLCLMPKRQCWILTVDAMVRLLHEQRAPERLNHLSKPFKLFPLRSLVILDPFVGANLVHFLNVSVLS